MKETSELLFLLSSEDRLNILKAILDERLRLSQLASKFSMTTQETSRQLARLGEAKLVEKDTQGLYGLTGLGKLALKLIPSFDFLVERSEYLLSHDITFLPSPFVERIGELVQGRYGEGLGSILDHFDRVLSESKEYVWLMADQVLMGGPIVAKLSGSERISWKIILPAAVVKHEGFTPFPSEFKGKVEVGLVDEVKAGIAMNEGLAGIAFPDKKGKIDFDSALQGRDASFRQWCTDLFMFWWSGAKKVF